MGPPKQSTCRVLTKNLRRHPYPQHPYDFQEPASLGQSHDVRGRKRGWPTGAGCTATCKLLLSITSSRLTERAKDVHSMASESGQRDEESEEELAGTGKAEGHLSRPVCCRRVRSLLRIFSLQLFLA